MAKSITATAYELSQPGSQMPAFELIGRWTWRALIFILASLVLFLGYLVAYGDLYKPGSLLGYNLGLVGGLMMLTLLAYPLRKRIPFLEGLGPMPSWFRYHMVFGIVGPILILFHSTFKTSSINARIAFYAMILVTVSGIAGRFIYRQVSIGLYGRELTLTDVEEELKARSEDIDSAFALQPEILARLRAFREASLVELNGTLRRACRFGTLHLQGKVLVYSLRGLVMKALVAEAGRLQWTRSETKQGYKRGMRQIERYVNAVCKTARYSTWQYIFSLWHLVHIPFLYLLVFSGIFHVIAVHMY